MFTPKIPENMFAELLTHMEKISLELPFHAKVSHVLLLDGLVTLLYDKYKNRDTFSYFDFL